MSDGEQRHRVVFLGCCKVGKTAILKRFLTRTFVESYKETVEDLFCRDFESRGTTIKVDFLDTAGNNEFPVMRKLSITTGHAFVLVYSITSEKSFEEMKKIWEQIKEERSNYQELPCVIVGNKLDLENNRQVEKFDALNWIYSEGFCGGFVEVSAKNEQSNVADIFRLLLEQSRGSQEPEYLSPRRMSLGETDDEKAEKAEKTQEWDSDAIKFNRSRSLIRRVSKPRVRRTRHHGHHNKDGHDDCTIS